MDVYGPLRAALFIYECIRLIIMIGVFAVLLPLQDASLIEAFPYAVYIVPNALFPLMTCFLWLRLSLYRSYTALYIAGKIIGVTSIIGWYVFSFRALVSGGFTAVSFMLGRTSILTAGITLITAALDTLSILGGVMLNRKLTHLEAQEKHLEAQEKNLEIQEKNLE